MKLTQGCFATFLIILMACNSNHTGEIKKGILSSLVNLTENEDKGIKEIIGFYGGQCEYGFEEKINIGASNETNFWIKFSKSTVIDSLEETAELPCSNIAYLFYKNLDKEKSKYNQIESELIFNGGQNFKHSYTVAELEKVRTKVQLIDKIVAAIRDKNFTGIKKYLKVDTAIVNYNADGLVANLQKAEPNFGKINQFIPYGFKFSKLSNGHDLLHISGLIERDKNSNYFSVNLDPNSLEEEIYTLNYKL